MNRRKALFLAVLLFTAILAVRLQVGNVFTHGQATTPVVEGKTPKQAEVKELLLPMDTDKNGKISEQEWMTFMEAEFDRLDKDKSGELDSKELMESRVSVDMRSRLMRRSQAVPFISRLTEFLSSLAARSAESERISRR